MSDVQTPPTLDLGTAFSKAWDLLTDEDRIDLLSQATKKLGERMIINALAEKQPENVVDIAANS